MDINCVIWFISGLALSSNLRVLDWPPLNCTQKNLQCSVQINNCSDEGWISPRIKAPVGPNWTPGSEQHVVGVRGDLNGDLLPVITVSWSQGENMAISAIRGTEVHFLEETSNHNICVRYIFHSIIKQNSFIMNNWSLWTFSSDRAVVEPGHTYLVSVYNLPKPDVGSYRIAKSIKIPGCYDRRIQDAKVCLENGSLWDPQLTWNISVEGGSMMILTVGFNTSEFSEEYSISIQNPIHSQSVRRENRTLLNVTFQLDVWQLPPCKILVVIQPFFIRCNKNCSNHQKILNYCLYYRRPPAYSRIFMVKVSVGVIALSGLLAYLLKRTFPTDSENHLSPTHNEELERNQVEKRRKVLVIYSRDHPLYTHVVLKLCAFLMAKCGTEVVLDLLDTTTLGIVGTVQWLDWQREQIEKSSDKILILCSRGVRAKWMAMCDAAEAPVALREDMRSVTGDMLTPALSLLVPAFVRSGTFRNYVVAYFEDVCSEEDVPSPFNITVRYSIVEGRKGGPSV
ncbi:interleukin-17 receptor A [Esox lucius]|uniref:interleukin-17 receptor A n=1 Tax=Esox lucius TaxID=8010 RepID=UPI0009733B5B|nr:interleukin-17 receptor A [Esox lucius]